ncbi:MAG TPA: hypothetical protein PKA74_08295 [Bauldia sp.]|nr:hypothetical protein [Bauldia sp.]
MAMALGGCMAGTTYGTGVSPGKQTVDDIVGIVSLGNASSKPPIDYKPRPPIVAPPKAAALPPPEDPKPATAANWPTDPDQKSTTASGDVYIPVANNKSAFADDGKDLGERAYEDHLRFGKQKQKVYADAKAAAAGTFDANGNPIRRTLSEPPSSYRVPDPDAPDEFSAAPAKKKWWQFGK